MCADFKKFVQAQDWFLAGSGCTLSATSITLTSMKYPDGTDVVTADLGSMGYGTFEPETSREENISFTTITQNANGTATLTGVTRGLKFKDPYDQDLALRLAHAGGALFRMSNSAPFYSDFASKNNDETFTGIVTFTDPNVPRMDVPHTYIAGEEKYFATKQYVDDTAFAGAPDASTTQKGIVQLATQAQADARTTVGSTGALLAITPDLVRSTLLHDFTTSVVGTDSYAITVVPAVTAYALGQEYVFEADVANTGAATLAVNGLAVTPILKNNNIALATGDIKAGQIVTVTYDGANFQLQSPTTPSITTLEGVNGDTTTANFNESMTFFANTALTAAQANTLSAGTTSNADTLHTHNNLVTSLNTFMQVSTTADQVVRAAAFSDATTKLITTTVSIAGGGDAQVQGFACSNDIGAAILHFDRDVDTTAQSISCAVYIGTDWWAADDNGASGDRITKNSGAVTIVGGDPSASAMLGHDPGNSYLLALDTTTRIRRYSGIAGATITLVDDITLDTAVSNDAGFLFEDTNNRFICVDKINNVIRRFDIGGTTIDTVAYTISDSNVQGVVMIKDRVYLVVVTEVTAGGDYQSFPIDLIPTTMTR